MPYNSYATFSKFRSHMHNLLQTRHSEKHFGFPSGDTYAAFCVAKDLLQDTHEGWLDIRAKKIKSMSMARYIEFWGLLQAIIIQQDALNEMHLALSDQKLPKAITEKDEWKNFRQLRNELAGHPVNNVKQKKFRIRSSISRNGLTHSTAQVTKYDSQKGKSEIYFISLEGYIDSYYRYATLAVYLCYRSMRERWR